MNDRVNKMCHSLYPNEIWLDWLAGLLPSAGSHHRHLALPPGETDLTEL